MSSKPEKSDFIESIFQIAYSSKSSQHPKIFSERWRKSLISNGRVHAGGIYSTLCNNSSTLGLHPHIS
jgi:hypothetical protein